MFLASVFFITGCSESGPKCGDEDTKQALLTATRENYSEKLQEFLNYNVIHTEYNKNESGDFLKSCTGTIEVKFKDDIYSKYKELDNEINKINSFAFTGGTQILKDIVKVSYKIKKNESGDGHFVSGSYTSENSWKLSPIVIERVNNYDKIINASQQLDILKSLNSILSNEDKNGIEIQKIAADKNLNIDYCEQNINNSSFQISCRLSNESGFVDIVSKRDFNYLESEMFKILGATTKTKISDPTSIKNFLNDKNLFTSSDEVNSAKTCKLVPSICRIN